MTLSKAAKIIIRVLEHGGYDAYAVGGCVRDFIMGRKLNDIDIATSAQPEEMIKVFDDNSVRHFETGIKHGTITAIADNENIEVTTFRTDGDYLDSRHPENVTFVTDIKDDLSRRDFTINALAYNDKTGIIDLFGGVEDIEKGLIRAVGNADKRFKEDALRIMRALRFSSVLSFDIEEKTKKALFENKELLKNVSAERIYAELSKLLMGDNVFDVLVNYKEIIAYIIPELEPILDISQNTKWHIYDVWQHTAKSVESAPKDAALRYAMLFHDIGKAFTKTTDENSIDHFKGHQKISAEYAQAAFKRLKAPNTVCDRAMAVIPIHDIHISTQRKNIKKMLSRLGENTLKDLIAVKTADKLAQNPSLTGSELENLKLTQEVLNSIIESGEPFTVKDLALNGNDLMQLGFHGVQIGGVLNYLLDLVVSDETENNKSSLLEKAIDYKNNSNIKNESS